MPSGATLLVIYGQDTPNTGRYKINYNFSILAFSSFTGISASKFTNPNPTTQTVGGIQAGSTFGGDYYLQEMMDLLLYPAVTPSFSSFQIASQSTSLEVGETVVGSKTFTWSIANAADLEPNSIDIEDTTNSTILATSLANDGTETVFLSSVSRTTPGANVWTISAQDTDLVAFSRTYQIDWYYATFYGIDASTTLNAAAIVALAGSALALDINSSYSFAGTGYGYICVPDSFSTPTGFRDSTTNLPIEMAGTAEGYNYFDGAFYHDSVSVTRNGIPITYRVYRTRNTITTSTIGVGLTGATVATLQSVINAGNIANGNAAILGNFSATTFYSGSTPLNTILGNYVSGLTTYVQPGVNTYTGGTPSRPIVGVIGNPTFTSVTSTSVFSTDLSGGTLYSGSTNIGVLFGDLFAPISITNTYVQPGWNILTGGTPTRPVISVYAYPIFSSVTTGSMSASTVFSNTITGNTFYSGSTPLNTILEQFGTINTTYVQPGTNIATGGTPTSPIVSVVGEPVFTSVTANFISALIDLSGWTIYSAGTNLSHIIGGTSTFVQEGLNTTTGGTIFRPIVNLAGSIVLTGVTASILSATTLSATTFYSGSTSLNDILSTLGSGSSTFVQPGLNVYTGGTPTSPIVGTIGSPNFTAVTANSITALQISGVSISATTFYSGSNDLNQIFGQRVWQNTAGVSNSIEPLSAPNSILSDDSFVFGGTIGASSNGSYALGSIATIGDASEGASIFGGYTNTIGFGNYYASIFGGFVNTIADSGWLSLIVGGESNIICGSTTSSSIIGAANSTIQQSVAYGTILGGVANIISDYSYASGIAFGLTNTIGYGAYSSFIFGGSQNLISSGLTGATILGGNQVTATTNNTTYVPYLNIHSAVTSASTFVLAIQDDGSVTRMSTSGVTTYVQAGLNITTGGTFNAPIVSLAGSIVLTGVSVTGNLTDLRSSTVNGVYFKRSDNEIANSPDMTFDEGLSIFNVAGTISGNTFYSAGTSLNDIVQRTYVQPGLNITTGGTEFLPIVNVSGSPLFTAVTATSLSASSVFGTSISATTLYSGGTDLGFIIANASTYVQPGLNTYTGGTASSPIVGTIGSPTFTAVTATSIIGTTSVSAVTFYSGSTNLSHLLGQGGASTYVQPGTNTTTGGTITSPVINVVDSPSFTSVNATSITATTFYSGTTSLNTILSSLGGGSTTYVQPGLNITTGGTAFLPVVNLAGSISLTGISAISISGTSLSGGTIYSGSSGISAFLAPRYPKTVRNSGTYILQLDDASRPVLLSGASTQYCVVPRNSSVAFDIGSQCAIIQTGAGQVNFSADTGVTILSYSGLTKIIGQYGAASLLKTDTNEWHLVGQLT